MGIKRSREELEILAELKRNEIALVKARGLEAEYREKNRAEFAVFLPHQRRALGLIRERKKTIVMVTGNRGGKTTTGAILVALLCVPELRERKGMTWLTDYFPLRNGRARILAKDWEHFAANVIVPALKEWLPAGTYETKRNNVGVEAFWTFRSGWTIEMITNVQATENQEGWRGHLVWQDETTTRDKYVTNKRGLIDFSGVYFMTFTAVNASWVLDDLIENANADSTVGVIQGVSTYENTFLDVTDIKNYENTLTEDERKARISGNFLNYEGRVWKAFEKDTHVIDPFVIPRDWPVYVQIDYHLNKPHAVSFLACDKADRWFVIDEVWRNVNEPVELAYEIIDRKVQKGWRIEMVEIDPLARGDTKYMKNRGGGVQQAGYDIVKNALVAYGIQTNVAAKDEINGIKNIAGRLRGMNGIPALYFFNNLPETIRQMFRWVYDENGKPSADGHFPECLYRFSLMGVKYTEPYKSMNLPKQLAAGVV